MGRDEHRIALTLISERRAADGDAAPPTPKRLSQGGTERRAPCGGAHTERRAAALGALPPRPPPPGGARGVRCDDE